MLNTVLHMALAARELLESVSFKQKTAVEFPCMPHPDLLELSNGVIFCLLAKVLPNVCNRQLLSGQAG